VTVTLVYRAVTRVEVEILVSFDVPHPDALAFGQNRVSD
jgi:hypothetical protein